MARQDVPELAIETIVCKQNYEFQLKFKVNGK